LKSRADARQGGERGGSANEHEYWGDEHGSIRGNKQYEYVQINTFQPVDCPRRRKINYITMKDQGNDFNA